MTARLQAQSLTMAGRLRATSLILDAGSCVALIGPNGAGKTSLLRALAGVESDGGQCRIDGKNLAALPPAHRVRTVAFMTASRDLGWPITVRDVLALGPCPPTATTLDTLIDDWGLAGIADRAFPTLSTGERSRALIARTMALNPAVLLLDEPLANLDPYWQLRGLDLLQKQAERTGAAILLSLHTLDLIDRFRRVLVMDRGNLTADDAPPLIITSPQFHAAFGVERRNDRWAIRPSADRRSLP